MGDRSPYYMLTEYRAGLVARLDARGAETVDAFDGGAQVGSGAIVFAVLSADWSDAPNV